jgi:hypothetical protein
MKSFWELLVQTQPVFSWNILPKYPGLVTSVELRTVPLLRLLKLGLQRNSRPYSCSFLIVGKFAGDPSPVTKFRMKNLSKEIEYR